MKTFREKLEFGLTVIVILFLISIMAYVDCSGGVCG